MVSVHHPPFKGQWCTVGLILRSVAGVSVHHFRRNSETPDVNAPVFADFPMTMECRVKECLNRSETGYMPIGAVNY